MYHKPTSDTLEHGENCYQTVIKRWISALCCLWFTSHQGSALL